MSLSGRIETISFHGILQLLCKENKTGTLRVRNDEGTEFQFFLLKGNILYAVQAFKETRLGVMLVRNGVTTQAVIDQCLEKAKTQKKALGKVLVDEGHISSDLLHHYIYSQILEILVIIFRWEKGEFSYRDQKFNLNWLVVLRINTIQLLMDALQQMDEHDASGRKMKDPQ